MSGQGTHTGIDFQNKVGANLAVTTLTEEQPSFLELPRNVTISSIAFESNAPVDDILIETSVGGFCFVNVKLNVTISDKPKSALGSVIDQFVRQWIACEASSGVRTWERPIDPVKDRLVLITGGTGTKAFVKAATNIITRIKDFKTTTPKENITNNDTERRVYDALRKLIIYYWNRHAGVSPPESTIAALLSITKITVADPYNTDRTTALSLLRSSILKNSNDAEKALSILSEECFRIAKMRSITDQDTLREKLRENGIALKAIPKYDNDISTLIEFSKYTLEHLEHLSHLNLPSRSNSPSYIIDRKVTHALMRSAETDSMLLIGPPGSGKSGTIYSAAKYFIESKRPVVVIAVDLHPIISVEDFNRNLGLETSFFEVLKAWKTQESGIIFIDSLDATRGGPSDKVFQHIIQYIINHIPNWRVVASIRDFDLRFGVEYRQLFTGPCVDEEFHNPDFKNIKHLFVPILSEEELDGVCEASPAMEEAYISANPEFKKLLANPFNLFLLSNILSTEGQFDSFKGVSNQLELLNQYWSHRVIGSDHKELDREGLLRNLASEMMENKTLFVSRKLAEKLSSKGLRHLLSSGVLTASKMRGDNIIRISLSHHMLFDYALARLVLESGYSEELISVASTSDDKILVFAPAIMLALLMLWEEDDTRKTFWERSLIIANVEESRAFGRMLPARVAAEQAKTVKDFSPLMPCLINKDDANHHAALFLIQHCLGSLTTAVIPEENVIGPDAFQWCQILDVLTMSSINDVGWMVRPVLSKWVEKHDKLTSEQKLHVGSIARRLLEYGIALNDEGSVTVSIQAISRTFDSAPNESFESLLLLIEPERVLEHGHVDLFWLGEESKFLITCSLHGTEFVSKLYIATFCTKLPSRDEKTILGGSQILPLISNKRQDFEMAQYVLNKYFVDYVLADPLLATQVIIQVMEYHVQEEHKDNYPLNEFKFGNIGAYVQKDFSSLWMTHHDKGPRALLHNYKKGLKLILSENKGSDIKNILEIIINRNKLACIWSAILDVGVAHFSTLGYELMPLLSSPEILDGIDTRKPAGDLIFKLHPILSEEDRLSIELAILKTHEEYTQPILIGCLDELSIASEEVIERRDLLMEKGPLPENRPSMSISTGWSENDENWWLKEQGVNLGDSINKNINDLIENINTIRPDSEGISDKQKFFISKWDRVVELFKIIQKNNKAPEALIMKGWDTLSEMASVVLESCENKVDVDKFENIEEIITGTLNEQHWPYPRTDQAREESFANMVCWSSPAPRISGAGALMSLARCLGPTSSQQRSLIIKCSRDPVPGVRHQILSRVNFLLNSDPNLMWELCEIAFTRESNIGVLSFFLGSVLRIVKAKPDWITDKLNFLLNRTNKEEDSRNQYVDAVTNLVLNLWLMHKQDRAQDFVKMWIADPIKHSNYILTTLTSFRSLIVLGSPSKPDPNDEIMRERVMNVFHEVTKNTISIFAELVSRSTLNDSETKTLETALSILDQAATEIYFGSGAYGAKESASIINDTLSDQTLVNRRFIKEMKPTLEILAEVGHPSVTHNVLQTLEFFIKDDSVEVFRMVNRTLVSGGQSGRYHFETLGAQLVVKIIRRYLADFRSVLTEHEDCREGLMNSLDLFVEVGWPEARQLVYELPEMLR